MNWFRLQFATKCQKCHDDLEPGDWACYDRDKNLLCHKCGEEEEEDGN